MADSNPTQLSDTTITGALNVTGTAKLGSNSISFAGLRSSVASVALGTVAGDSVTTSVTVTGVAAGDPILAILPASIWSGAYHDVGLSALATATDTVVVAARNSTITGVNTAAMNFTFYWLDLA